MLEACSPKATAKKSSDPTTATDASTTAGREADEMRMSDCESTTTKGRAGSSTTTFLQPKIYDNC
jgi:hypothetical protein